MNTLDPGNGGLPSPSPGDSKANPLAMKSQPRPASKMMQHFGSAEDAARDKYNTVKGAKTQIDAVMGEFEKLTGLQDTVQSKDVVKGCGGIVAAGVPAVQIASILAEMPEQGQALQAWVKQKFDEAVKADQQITQALVQTRHDMIAASLRSLVAHSAEAKMMSGPAQGNA